MLQALRYSLTAGRTEVQTLGAKLGCHGAHSFSGIVLVEQDYASHRCLLRQIVCKGATTYFWRLHLVPVASLSIVRSVARFTMLPLTTSADLASAGAAVLRGEAVVIPVRVLRGMNMDVLHSNSALLMHLLRMYWYGPWAVRMKPFADCELINYGARLK